jgi:small subunit ribosomal protein S15
MTITKERKQELVTKFGETPTNTGSTKVQIAIVTERIVELTEHLKKHKKDNHTRYGLMKLVGQRRGLLDYLIKTDINTYREIVKELNIRK